MELIHALKTKDHQSDNFTITNGTVCYHYDNLRGHQWWQNSQFDNILFLVHTYGIL